MPTFPRAGVLPSRSAPFGLTLTNQSRLYFPGRGLGYSLLFHGFALTVLLLFPMYHTPKERVPPWPRTPKNHPNEARFVMYLPSIGGGGQGGGGGLESPGGEPTAAPSSGKEGLVYPGPQLVRSDPPDPSNLHQTLLQPELKDLPILTRPLDLPNLLTMPDLGDVQPPPPPDRFIAPPDADKPEEPQPTDSPDVEATEVVQSKVEDLPTVRRPSDLPNLLSMPDVRPVPQSEPADLAVGLADPDEAEDQQPLEPSDGLAIEPVQLKVEDLPTVGRPSDLPNLLSMPDAGLVQKSPPPDPAVEPPDTAEPNEQQPVEPLTVAAIEAVQPTLEPLETTPIDTLEPGSPIRLPSPGTDLHSFLALTPLPTLSGQPVEIPAAEARGRFTISPEPNLDTPETEPGVLSAVELENPTVDPAGETAEGEDLPSVVTLTFGPRGGEGTGSASGGEENAASGSRPGVGSGSGSGSGAGSGSGSGAGSGPGAGPFAGITIVGGVGGTATAGSGPGPDSSRGPLAGFTIVGGAGGTETSGSDPGNEGPFAGITVVGGVGEPEASANPFPVSRMPRPLPTEYGLFALSTENSGGGLPYVGVFSDEQIHTVFLDMRASEHDAAPLWPLEFAVPTESEEETTPARQLDESRPRFEPPAPTVKGTPELPLELVRRHLLKMVIVYAVINAEGKMEQMSVQESPDPLLNQPVLDALSRWVFRPGTLHGAPVPVRALVGIPLWLPAPAG